MKKVFSFIAVVVLLAVGAGMAFAAFPERSINMIVPFGAGGGTDVWNRTLAAMMEKTLGQKIIVNNMTGAGGGTGTAYVWNAKHDGYTICATSETPLTLPVMTGMEQTAKDWEYFIAGGSPGLLCVNKSSGFKTFDDLVAAAKAAPDKIKIASTAGGLWFIHANLFSKYGDVPLGNATYDGSRPAILACVSGETIAVSASAGEVADFIKAGELIPLIAVQPNDYDMAGFGVIQAVTKKIPALDKYLPINQWLGFCIPSDTPDEAKAALTKAFNAATQSPEFKKFAGDQFGLVYNLTGADAKALATKQQESMCWILQDMGKTQHSPEKFGIKKP